MNTRRPVFRRRRRGRVVVVLVVAALVAAVVVALGFSSAGSTEPGAAADTDPVAESPAPSVSLQPATSPTETAAARAPDPSPSVTASRTTAEPVDLTALGARLDGIVASMSESLAGAEVAVAVRDAAGRVVLDRNADVPLMPASTLKMLTTAAVLQTFGPQHRFETVVAATAPPHNGRVSGDLVLVGGGDPVLSSDDYHRWVYPSRPRTSLTALADAVVDAGITEVTGGLLADATAWAPAQLASGWPGHYLSDQDARRISALTVDAGLWVEVDLAEDGGGSPEVRLLPVRDPAGLAAARLAALLAERGVVIRGHVRTSPFPVETVAEIASVSSPTVAELLEFTVQRSDNHLADTLLRAVAAAGGNDGSWSAAHRSVAAVLDDLGIDTVGLRLADGSGLSRLDRVTAAQLVELDVVMTGGPFGNVWHDSLAVAGVSGTLEHRLVGTPGQGRFLGKTGTLDDVKAVVGHVTGDGDERFHLAVVANGVPAGGQWAVTVLMDTLQLALVDELDGCTTTEGEDGPVRSCPDAVVVE